MIFTAQQLDAEAGRLAAEANAALAAGDTPDAARLFREAGKSLELRIPNLRKQAAKHLQRFLAATQYYHGGAYRRAEELCRKVQRDVLPPELHGTYDQFLRDVRDRCAEAYPERVKQALKRALAAKDFEKALAVLHEHPYALPPAVLAYLRGDCCEHLKNYRAAALFLADATRFEPNDLNLVFNALASPLSLLSDGNVAEAWEYVLQQLRVCDHPIVFMNASMVRQRQAHGEHEDSAWRRLADEQFQYCEGAWARFGRLPAEQQQHREMRNLMALCLEASVFPLMRMGNRALAVEMAHRAVSCDPASHFPWTARGIATYPSAEAIGDFKKAVSLHDPTYFAYYYLAHASFTAGTWGETVRWCEQALGHGASHRIKAALLEMLAIARSQLGHDAEAVKKLFQEAIALDPANQRTAHNMEVFVTGLTVGDSAANGRWDRQGFEPATPTESPADWQKPFPGRRGIPALSA